MKKVAFAGTFDPLTTGHLWMIRECASMAQQVVILIAKNNNKKTLLSSTERLNNMHEVLRDEKLTNVLPVIVENEYIAKHANRLGAQFMIRGLRNTVDFEYENLLQQTNSEVLKGCKTLFLMPPSGLASVSSSYIKTLMGPVGWHWQVKKFLPAATYRLFLKKYLEQKCEQYFPNLPQLKKLPTDAAYSSLINVEAINNTDHMLYKILTCYEGRSYHNIEHLVHCVSELERLDCKNKHKLFAALLMHDAVMKKITDSHLPSDEEMSAQLTEDLWHNGKEPADLVRSTSHFSTDKTIHPLQHEMVSIDLAILGQERDVYDQYSLSIREEYRDVDDAAYCAGRLKVLNKLLDRANNNTLYRSKTFSKRYNDSAKENLLHEIGKLSEIL